MGTKLSPVGSSQSGGGSIGPTTPTDFTEGSVIFAGATELAENNAAFFWDDADTQLRLTAGAATKTPLEVKAAAAQSANLFEWKNNSDTVLGAVKANGSLQVPSLGYGAVNASVTAGNGSQIASNGDGTWFFGASYVTGFSLSVPNQALQMSSAFQYSWGSTSEVAGSGPDTGLARSAAGIVKVTNGSSGGGSLHFQEQTAPSAPATNNVYLYAQDNGAGKTQLMALFATGSAVEVAIEP